MTKATRFHAEQLASTQQHKRIRNGDCRGTETKYLIRYRNGGQAWVSQWHLDNFGKTGTPMSSQPDAIRRRAEAATDGPWVQGRFIDSHHTSRKSDEWKSNADEQERLFGACR